MKLYSYCLAETTDDQCDVHQTEGSTNSQATKKMRTKEGWGVGKSRWLTGKPTCYCYGKYI